MFENKKELNEFILIRNLIDLEYLLPYQEIAIRRKITPFIPADMVEELKTAKPEIYKLIKTAVANYMMPYAIPQIKVLITNSGISNQKDDRRNNANWWDVRDMALNCAKIADEALTDAMDALVALSDYKNRLSFLKQTENLLFHTPDEFFSLTKINGGYDVFQNLIPTMEHIWLIIFKSKFQNCVLEELHRFPELEQLFKTALAFYTLADAAMANAFVITGSGIFVKWEQLPWQKSEVLSEVTLFKFSERMTQRANEIMHLIMKFIDDNIKDFPCMQNVNDLGRKIHIRKSGIYF